jgi:recombination DNA repair RAD52 pathway protein
MLSAQQLHQLYQPINPKRVAKHPHSGMSYIKSWDMEAHLGRIFGLVGWDDDTEFECVFEDFVTWTDRKTGQEKSGWDVCYRAKSVLILKDVDGNAVSRKSGAATGSATHQPSRSEAHDLALKDACSDALKRAAKKLGNQFGLSLYDNGSIESVVGRSLADATTEAPDPTHNPEQHRRNVAEVRDRMLGERESGALTGRGLNTTDPE